MIEPPVVTRSERPTVVKAPTRDGHLSIAAFFHEAVILAAQVIGVDAPPVESWMHVMAPTVKGPWVDRAYPLPTARRC
jgi:hypothetical protein